MEGAVKSHSYKQACESAMLAAQSQVYRMTDADGVRCSGRVVAMARGQAKAERRFFRRLRTVSPEPDEIINPDTLGALE